MSTPLPHPRFPGFEVMDHAEQWDPVTRQLVRDRLDPGPGSAFFSRVERRAAAALFDQLTGQDREPRIPVLQMVETRLATGSTDGWHHQDLPHDDEAWRQSLHHLDADAVAAHGSEFADLAFDEQQDVIRHVQDMGGGLWHGMRAAEIWNMWMRYVCSAFYSHPRAWNEIGFPGPAFPRGYKNPGLDRREGFEVADAGPGPDGKEGGHRA